jgi:uncharacterized phiE125 gp8 family phage protein
MALKLTTPAAVEPVSLVEAKAHLRVDFSDDDIYILALIKAARGYCEGFSRRAFFTQSWLLALDHFPGANDYQQGYWDYGVLGDAALGLGMPAAGYTMEFKSEVFFRAGAIIIPYPPLQTIDSIKYLDPNGVLQTLDPTLYQVDNISEPARVAPAANQTWPLTQISVRAPILNAVQVAFTCGFGTATNDGSVTTFPTTFPVEIAHAMKLLIGHWYENRLDVLTGARAASIEVHKSVTQLLWLNRVMSVA